jgi:hypothetical protein
MNLSFARSWVGLSLVLASRFPLTGRGATVDLVFIIVAIKSRFLIGAFCRSGAPVTLQRIVTAVIQIFSIGIHACQSLFFEADHTNINEKSV